MNTAVAVTDQICRTVLYLAGMGVLAYLARPMLARTQVTNPRGQGRAAQSAGPAVVSVAGEQDGRDAA
jgi:threonine/homoserine/homoserine lactone efflux protein